MGSQSQQSKRAYRKRQKKQKKLKKRQAVKESSSGCSNSEPFNSSENSSENNSQSSSSVTNLFELSSHSDNSSAPSGQLKLIKHHSTKKDTMTVIYNDPLYIKMIEYRMHKRRISQLVNQNY